MTSSKAKLSIWPLQVCQIGWSFYLSRTSDVGHRISDLQAGVQKSMLWLGTIHGWREVQIASFTVWPEAEVSGKNHGLYKLFVPKHVIHQVTLKNFSKDKWVVLPFFGTTHHRVNFEVDITLPTWVLCDQGDVDCWLLVKHQNTVAQNRWLHLSTRKTWRNRE